MKKISYFLAALLGALLFFSLFSCGKCEHEWKDATCTTAKTCTKCGITEGEPLGHTYGDWIADREATEAEVGAKHRICSVCGKTETAEIAKLSHTHKYSAEWSYKCPYCNAEIHTSDFDVLAQSNFKVRNSFLEETRLSMMKELRDATRLVFIGYSMPNDDTDYITMFKSLYESVKEVFVVSYAKGATNDFLSYEKLPESKEKGGLKNFDSVFKEKARYNMAGFPQTVDKILRVCR